MTRDRASVARLVASRPGKRAEEGGNVSGYPVVDVAIGLSFVYFLFSVFSTAITETISRFTKTRAHKLEGWLKAVLAHPDGSVTAVHRRVVASVALP